MTVNEKYSAQFDSKFFGADVFFYENILDTINAFYFKSISYARAQFVPQLSIKFYGFKKKS